MTVGSVCSRELVTADREASLLEAAQLMREHHVGSVVVTQQRDGGLHVAGIVTDRDLALGGLAPGIDAQRTPLARLLGEQPTTPHSVPQDAELGDAIALMQAQGVRRLLVRDAAGHLAGIVSFDDLLAACAAQLGGLAGVLHQAIEREAARRAPLPPRPMVRVPAVGTAGWQAEGYSRAGPAGPK